MEKLKYLDFLCFLLILVTQLMNAKDDIICERECLDEPEIKKCDKKFPNETFYYNYTESKCVVSYCFDDPEDVTNFNSVKECEKRCTMCTTLSKKYKKDDDCLKELDYVKGNSTVLLKGKVIIWAFNFRKGMCLNFDLNRNGTTKEGYRFTQGLTFNSKEDCDKKCPPAV